MEIWRRTVVIVLNMGKKGKVIVIILERTPQELHLFSFHSIDFVLIVKPCEEERVEAHLSEKCCGGWVMPERVDVPGYVRNIIQSVFKPFQPYCHLVNEVFIVDRCFIGSTPAAIDELQLPICH